LLAAETVRGVYGHQATFREYSSAGSSEQPVRIYESQPIILASGQQFSINDVVVKIADFGKGNKLSIQR